MNTENKPVFAFDKVNYILLGIGVATLALGFVLMSGGGTGDPNVFYPDGDPTKTPEIFSFRRITLAPIVVVFSFAFIALAIMADKKWPILNKIFK